LGNKAKRSGTSPEDKPLDYHRWTIHGLRSIAGRLGFEIVGEQVIGPPVETAGLLSNIALSKTALNWIRKKSVLSILILLLPILIVAISLLSWAVAGLSGPDDMMPHGYRLILKKARFSEKNPNQDV